MDKPYKPNGTQSRTYYTTQGPRNNGKYLPAKGPGNGQDGNEGDEGRDDKKKFRNTKYNFKDKREEESDTANSYEINPRQLSQVTSGGRVLKIKLSKKKPIKITAGAPEGELDPAQTKVKTVHEPINKESGQPPSSVSPNVLVETKQPKEKKIPPVRASQPTLGIGERKRPNIPTRRVGGPNGNGSGDPEGKGSSHGHGISSHGNRGSDENGNSPMNGTPQEERNSQGGGGGSNGDRGSNGSGDPPR